MVFSLSTAGNEAKATAAGGNGGAGSENSNNFKKKESYHYHTKEFAARQMIEIISLVEKANIPHEFDYEWTDVKQ